MLHILESILPAKVMAFDHIQPINKIELNLTQLSRRCISRASKSLLTLGSIDAELDVVRQLIEQLACLKTKRSADLIPDLVYDAHRIAKEQEHLRLPVLGRMHRLIERFITRPGQTSVLIAELEVLYMSTQWACKMSGQYVANASYFKFIADSSIARTRTSFSEANQTTPRSVPS